MTNSSVFRTMHPYADLVDREAFDALYDHGLRLTGTPASVWRKDRFFNLYSIAVSLPIPTATAECGAWKGLSSLLICEARRRRDPLFTGRGHYIIDSFEGLSAPTAEDRLPVTLKGYLSCSLPDVRRALKHFPDITYVQGFIPGVLKEVPEGTWGFVHIDVDLAAPTREAIEYFYPRLEPGGIILCDDYASVRWPGTKSAVDEFCRTSGARTIALATGQLMIMK